MGTRLELHDKLKDITPNVYFQPPNGLQMEYPCIRYRISDENVDHADNGPYKFTQRYQLTIIDKDPDGLIPSKVRVLPMVRFSRFYASGNLNHFVYDLYF